MTTDKNTWPVGVFDSGIGGISVLAEMVKRLPDEKYVYMADSANAPYGTKSCDCVLDISLNAAGFLAGKGIKALVVACNTATSVAINRIRDTLSIPVIGIEPALKPAVENRGNGAIAVMATPLTLQEEKFISLYRRYNTDAIIIPVPCPGLMELIESEPPLEAVKLYLEDIFDSLPPPEISSVVLGCTHYCFIRKEIAEVLPVGARIFDGNEGTVRHLARTLQSGGILAPRAEPNRSPEVEFFSSGDPDRMIPLCRRFLEKSLL